MNIYTSFRCSSGDAKDVRKGCRMIQIRVRFSCGAFDDNHILHYEHWMHNQMECFVISIHSFDGCKLDYRTECNRIRLTLFFLSPFKLQSEAVFLSVGREKGKKKWTSFSERRKKKSLLNSSSEQRLWKGLKFCWLISWNVSWQPRRYEQCNDKVETKCIVFQLLVIWKM